MTLAALGLGANLAVAGDVVITVTTDANGVAAITPVANAYDRRLPAGNVYRRRV